MAVAISPTSIAQDQNSTGIWVVVYSKLSPPPTEVVGNETGGLMISTDGQVSLIALHVIDTVRYYAAFAQIVVVMIVDLDRLLSIALACPVEVTQPLCTCYL